jgi:hypothetical protein
MTKKTNRKLQFRQKNALKILIINELRIANS